MEFGLRIRVVAVSGVAGGPAPAGIARGRDKHKSPRIPHPHKEYRFIYPAGRLSDGARRDRARPDRHRGQRMASRRHGERKDQEIGLRCSGRMLLVLAVFRGVDRSNLDRVAQSHARLPAGGLLCCTRAGPCGIGLYGRDGYDWLTSGGYTYFHRPAPLYWPKDPGALASVVLAFDTLISVGPTPAGLGFATLRCFGGVCVARRTGDCRPTPPMPMPFPSSLGLANAVHATHETSSDRAAAAR